MGNPAEKCRSKNKFIQIRAIIKENKSNIITLNELCTQHNNNTSLKRVNFEREFSEFKIYISKNEVAILVHKSINSTEAIVEKENKISGNHWSIYTLIYSGKKPIIVGSYYRSPSGKENPKDISNEIDNLRSKYKCNNYIINGDFNIEHELWDNNCDLTKFDENANNVLDLIQEQELVIINNKYKPTHAKYRIIGLFPVIYAYNSIDLSLVSYELQNKVVNWETNSYTAYGEDKSELDLQWISNVSDHFAIQFDINIKPEKVGSGIKQAWRLNSTHWDDFNEMLQILLKYWNEYCDVFENDNTKVDKIIELLTKAILIAAITTIGIKKYDNNSVGWMNRKIAELMHSINK